LTIILEDIAQKLVKGKMKIEKKSDEKKGDKEIKREKSE